MQEYKMPTIIYGNELKRKLLNLPEYSKSITNKSPPERLEKLSTLYDVYIKSYWDKVKNRDIEEKEDF